MKTFTKWFVMMALVVTASVVAGYQGIFTMILENDATYIALVCMILFVAFSIQAGKIAHFIDATNPDKETTLKRMEPAYFVAEHLMSLGLLGTTAGLAFTMNTALQTVDSNQLFEQLKGGVGRTLYTTIVALACSLLLEAELFIVQQKLK